MVLHAIPRKLSVAASEWPNGSAVVGAAEVRTELVHNGADGVRVDSSGPSDDGPCERGHSEPQTDEEHQ